MEGDNKLWKVVLSYLYMKIHPEILKRFGRNPKIIYKRDKFKCVICGSKNDLTIDHIDGNGRHSKKPNNDLNNLRTLCRSCHGREDGRGNYKKRKLYFNRWSGELKTIKMGGERQKVNILCSSKN